MLIKAARYLFKLPGDDDVIDDESSEANGDVEEDPVCDSDSDYVEEDHSAKYIDRGWACL